MAKLKISDYSSTSAGANLNTDINSIDIDEGCAPSGINNAIRTLMAQLKDFQTGVSGDSLTLGGALSGTSATFSGNITASAISGASLTLSGNVTASAISGASMTLSGDLTVDTNTLYVDATNNKVGIGTSSPSQLLEVGSDSTSNNYIQVSAANNTQSGIKFRSDSSKTTGWDIGYEGNGNYLFFKNDVAGSVTERMRIDSSGNVGIGTSSPTYRLQVQEGNATILAGADSSASTLTDATQKVMRFGVPHYTNAEEPVGALFASITSGENGVLIGGGTGVFNAATRISFHTAANTTTTNGTERMRIDSSGNVGIGTSSPSTYGKFAVVADTNGNLLTGVYNLNTGASTNSYIQISAGGRYTNLSANYAGQWFQNSGINLTTIYQDYDTQIFRNNAGTERMRIDSGGNLYLNTTTRRNNGMQSIDYNGSAAGGMGINDTASANGSVYIGFLSGGTFRGSITNNNNTAVAYNTTSDYRLKDNVIPMSDSIDRLKQLKPSTWTWIQNDSHGEGFLAHEVQTVVPEAVTGTKDAVDDEGNPVYQGIDQSKLVPLLTSALQEAIIKIEDLETRIQALENQ